MYLIKSVGLDIGDVNIGMSALTMRAGSWETSVVDAGAFGIYRGAVRHTTFNKHKFAGYKILDFVKKHRPDIVGVEDYTNQRITNVGFSMGQLGGVVRLLLWQHGFRQIVIVPKRLESFVIPTDAKRPQKEYSYKKLVENWVKDKLGAEFTGHRKAVVDMVDASVYALIAATFFSMYWLAKEPPLSNKQRNIFYSRVPPPSSALWKTGWRASGLLDDPTRYLIRNIEKEAETYTPEWMRNTLEPAQYVNSEEWI